MKRSVKRKIQKGLVWLLVLAMALQAAPGAALTVRAQVQTPEELTENGGTNGTVSGNDTAPGEGEPEDGTDPGDTQPGEGTDGEDVLPGDETDTGDTPSGEDTEDNGGDTDPGQDDAEPEDGTSPEDNAEPEEDSEEDAIGEEEADGLITEEGSVSANILAETQAELQDADGFVIDDSGVLTAYNDTDSNKEIVIPKEVKAIGEGVFKQTLIKKLSFEADSALEQIGDSAFQNCFYLEEADLSNCNRLVTIGRLAFENCNELQKVTFPDAKEGKLQVIEVKAFSSCDNLTTVGTSTVGRTFPESLTQIKDQAFAGVPFGYHEVNGNKDKCTDLVIPANVSLVGTNAFVGCPYISTVTFLDHEEDTEEEVTGTLELQSGCFATYYDGKGNRLTSVHFPNRLTEISAPLFLVINGTNRTNDALQKVTFGPYSRLTEIGDSAFSACYLLQEITLPEGLETIGENAFNHAGISQESRMTLVIPASVTRIKEDAFMCSELAEMIIFEDGDQELRLDKNSFYGIDAGVIILPGRLRNKKLDKDIFGNNAYTEDHPGIIYIPPAVTSIDDHALSVYWPPSVATIYGEYGSAAEKYAKAHNIAFKPTSELDVIVSDIALSQDEIIASGTSAETLQPKTVTLTATLLPETARNKKVSWSSTNERVATVQDGLVTLVGYGEADITARAEAGGRTASCHVKVLQEYTETEKQALSEALIKANTGTVVRNVYACVSDIPCSRPEDPDAKYEKCEFAWAKDGEAVQPGEHTYQVTVTQPGYVDTDLDGAKFTGCTVEGIELSGKQTLQTGRETSFEVKVLMAEAEASVLQQEDYDVSWSSSNMAALSVTKGGEAPLTASVRALKPDKTAQVKVRVQLKKKDGSVLPADAETEGETWFEDTVSVATCASEVADRMEIWIRSGGSEDKKAESKLTLADPEAPETYTLTAKGYAAEGEELTLSSLQWSSSDTQVAKLQANSDGSATLTVGPATGSSTITVRARQNGNAAATLRVTVKDSTPRLEETSVVISTRQKAPYAATVHLYPSDECAVQSVKLVNQKDDSAAAFSITKDTADPSGAVYTIQPTGTPAAGSSKLYLVATVQTDPAKKQDHRLPLTVTVKNTTPKVTVTQKAADALNLYEKDGTGKITVSADAPIESVSFVTSSTGGAGLIEKGMETFSDGKRQAVMTYTSQGATADNYKKVTAKGTLTVTFEGYDWTYTKTVTLKCSSKLPVFTAAAESGTLYPAYKVTDTTVTFAQKGTTTRLTKDDGFSITLPTDVKGITVKESPDDPVCAKVTMSEDAKSTSTLKFTVTNSKWISGVGAAVSCKIKKGSKPSLAFQDANLILNRKEPVKAVMTGLYLKDNADEKITRIVAVEGKNAAAKKNRDAFAFSLTADGTLRAGFNSKWTAKQIEARFPKQAKSSYLVTVRAANGIQVQGTLNVTVAVKDPAVTYKTSGSIDLLDRDGTQIVCKPVLKNCTGTVISAYLSGYHTDKFEAGLDDTGTGIVIKAKEGQTIRVKTTYKPVLHVTLDNGLKLEAQIKITPKQTNPKLTQSVKKLQMYEAVSGEKYAQAFDIGVAEGKNGDAKIAKVELLNGADTFIYKPAEEAGRGTLYVSEYGQAKAGKSYKLKFAVTFADGGANVSPATVTLTVNYKR